MKTIKEGNRLIAEFMGRCGKVNRHLYYVNIPTVKWVTIEEMQFHSSWDWLMPVVEKIESITETSDGIIYHLYDVVIRQHSCEIESADIHAGGFPSKMEATYWAVVEFIEWYNNKNSVRS